MTRREGGDGIRIDGAGDLRTALIGGRGCAYSKGSGQFEDKRQYEIVKPLV